MYKSLILSLASLFIVLFSCTEPTKPPVNNGPDTTSHDFSWTIDTIGTYGSYLKDVAIIDENNIWAVGEIHTNETDRYDSLGVWQPPFNAVHWDGNEWKYKRTLPTGIGFSPNRAVFAFNADDIWVGTSAPYHWDGQRWTVYNVTGIHNGYINKIWGTSSNDLYLVGTNGSISHYNGQSWQRIESGTDLDLRDISGYQDHVFITGHSDQYESIALELVNGTWMTRFSSSSYYGNPSSGDYGRMFSTVVLKDTAYIAAKSGIVKFNYQNEKVTLVPDETALYSNSRIVKISGNEHNDLLLVDGWGAFIHYNGLSWFKDNFVFNHFGEANFYPQSGHYKNNTAVFVGYCCNFGHGIIIRGHRL